MLIWLWLTDSDLGSSILTSSASVNLALLDSIVCRLTRLSLAQLWPAWLSFGQVGFG